MEERRRRTTGTDCQCTKYIRGRHYSYVNMGTTCKNIFFLISVLILFSELLKVHHSIFILCTSLPCARNIRIQWIFMHLVDPYGFSASAWILYIGMDPVDPLYQYVSGGIGRIRYIWMDPVDQHVFCGST